MVKMDKKGYLKTLEAVLAIVIILLFTFSVTPSEEAYTGVPENMQVSQDYILSQIAQNQSIRNYVVHADDSDAAYNSAFKAIDGLIKNNVPASYGYTFGICDMSSCMSNITSLALDKSIYSQDILITTDGEIQNPKVIRLWMWSKG